MTSYRHLGWFAIAAILIALCAAAVFPAYMNHDAAWYLHMASVWLDGGTLYRDVVDTNPPLIVFLTAIPVWIARAVGWSQPPVFEATVLFLAAGSVTACVRPIWRTWQTELSRGLISILLVFALFPFVAGDFGQREHFAAILVAPFVLEACAAAVGQSAGRLRSIVVGVLAGLGFALKPYFVIAWIAVEIALAILQRPLRTWRRPAAMAVVASMLVYAVVVITLVPNYLPLALEVIHLYAKLGPPLGQLLWDIHRDLETWIAVLAALILVRMPPQQRAPTVVLFAAATGFLAAALVQLKAWTYHFYPYQVFGLLFVGALAGGVADAHPAAMALVRGGRATLGTLVVALTVFRSARALGDARELTRSGDVASFVRFIEQQNRAESFALLSTRYMVVPYFPAVTYTHVRWVLRHNGLWFLGGLYEEDLKKSEGQLMFHSKGAMPPLEQKYFEQIVDDLCADPPGLLLIEPQVFGAHKFDLLGYYRQDARFDRLFAAYKPIPTVGSPLAAYVPAIAASCEQQRP